MNARLWELEVGDSLELGVLDLDKLSITRRRLRSKLNPRGVKEGGAAAIHFVISTAMMNQRLESWLLVDQSRAERDVAK